MKLKYLRWIDNYAGLPFCFIFFLAQRIIRLFRFHNQEPFDNSRIKKILIIKFWGFGSIILALESLRLIRKHYPAAYICALTLKQNRAIYEMSGLFDEILDIGIRAPLPFLLDTLKTLSRIRKLSFDVAFDLEFTARFSALFTYLSNAKRRIGFKYLGIWRGDCFSDTLEFQEDIKLRESFLRLSGLIVNKLDVLANPLELAVDNEKKHFINRLFEKEGLIGVYPLVGVNINASQLSLLRRWPKEYFAVLSEGLIRRYCAHIIFIGDKEDSRYVDETIRTITLKREVHNFAGKVSLPELVCLLQRLNLFISNDSGPLHLAAYMKIPTISFFGPETPLIYGPEGESHTVFYRNLDCSPCIRIKNYKLSRCSNKHRCLREIKPSEVLNEIEKKGIFSRYESSGKTIF